MGRRRGTRTPVERRQAQPVTHSDRTKADDRSSLFRLLGLISRADRPPRACWCSRARWRTDHMRMESCRATHVTVVPWSSSRTLTSPLSNSLRCSLLTGRLGSQSQRRTLKR